jgi:hypothetical protein
MGKCPKVAPRHRSGFEATSAGYPANRRIPSSRNPGAAPKASSHNLPDLHHLSLVLRLACHYLVETIPSFLWEMRWKKMKVIGDNRRWKQKGQELLQSTSGRNRISLLYLLCWNNTARYFWEIWEAKVVEHVILYRPAFLKYICLVFWVSNTV